MLKALLLICAGYIVALLMLFKGADDPSEDSCDCSVCNSGGGPHLPTQRKP